MAQLYIAYRGTEKLMTGTLEAVANKLNRSTNTVYKYATEKYKEKLIQDGIKGKLWVKRTNIEAHMCPAATCERNQDGMCCMICEKKDTCSEVCFNNPSKCKPK